MTQNINKEKNNIIFDKLKYKSDDNDPNTQEEYFNILDKIIDAAVLTRYEKTRKNFLFYSIDQIDEKVIYIFKKINQDNKDYLLNNLTIKLTGSTGIKRGQEEYFIVLEMLNKLYDLYQNTNNTLSHQFTTEFYNKILNRQKDMFISHEKEKIINNLIYSLPLTDKKRHSLEERVKLKKAKHLLANKTLPSYDKIVDELNNLHIYLNQIKPFSKLDKPISNEEFELFDKLFLEGNLEYNKLKEERLNYNEEELKIIINKYSKLLIPYVENIEINDSKLDYNTVKFNYNHLKIIDEKRYYNNLNFLLENLKEDETSYILDNINEVKEFFKLLTLTNLVNEFSINNLKAILLNYKEIKEYLFKNKNVKNVNFDYIIKNLFEITKLAIAYDNSDKFVSNILGEERISKILDEKATSRNPKDYISCYLEMLNSYESYIPPIKGEYHNYIYESGNNYDLDRLLIGKNSNNSCIGPNGAGEKAFYECLTEKNADILLIKKKNTNEFIARSLMFRKGNFIIMAPIIGQRGLNNIFYNTEFLFDIGKELLKNSIDKNDNLDYVFISSTVTDLMNKFPTITNDLFDNDLPHCDLSNSAYIIGSKKENLDLLPDIENKALYYKTRKKVDVKEKDFIDDISFIKSLEILMEKDEIKKEKLKENFSNIKESDYSNLYLGQDFYIALKKDGSIEKVILNTFDERQKKEIDLYLNNVIKNTKVDNFDKERHI